MGDIPDTASGWGGDVVAHNCLCPAAPRSLVRLIEAGSLGSISRLGGWTAIAKDAWREAQIDDRIDFRLGDAHSTLTTMPSDEPIDLVFIDADKGSYIDYWEILVPRVRLGGLLLADNVLYYGEAADDDATGNAKAIRAFNDHVRADDRVESVMLPISDGLTIARKNYDG